MWPRIEFALSDPWIPGDWGYMINPNAPPGDVLHPGQNLIYVGGGRFYGHPPGAVMTWGEWQAAVAHWNGAQGTQDPTRTIPKLGLASVS